MNHLKKRQLTAAVVSAAVTLVFGVLLTVNPDILNTICLYAGIAACILAAGLVITYFVKQKTAPALIGYGATAAVVGILLIIVPGLLRFLIPVLFGLWILFHSAMGMFRNFSLRQLHSSWWIGFLLCAVGAVIGVFVITRPVSTMQTTFRIIGISLIVFSILRLISAFMGRHYYTDASNTDFVETTVSKE